MTRQRTKKELAADSTIELQGQSGQSGMDEAEIHEEIARLAFQLWQKRGCPEGSPEQDWFDAIALLRAGAETGPEEADHRAKPAGPLVMTAGS